MTHPSNYISTSYTTRYAGEEGAPVQTWAIEAWDMGGEWLVCLSHNGNMAAEGLRPQEIDGAIAVWCCTSKTLRRRIVRKFERALAEAA